MKVSIVNSEIRPLSSRNTMIHDLSNQINQICNEDSPIRFAITENKGEKWQCEIECLSGSDYYLKNIPSIFAFRKREVERTNNYNVVMVIPTGVDCAVGGHAGDATAAAKLISHSCDNLILHPNVVNASDINEQPENSLYVEGSLISRLLMGQISLARVRNNRILAVTEIREDGDWSLDQVVNTVNAARAILGIKCKEVIGLKNNLSLTMALSNAGRAIGEVSGIEDLIEILEEKRSEFDAVAISSRITAPQDVKNLLHDYFSGNGPNPWGGVEAALTHTISTLFNVPSAHAPTLEDMELKMECFGQTDPRKAAEAISTSYAFCLYKGLQKAPQVIENPNGIYEPSVISTEDISCLIIPDGCIGIPTLAAILQGITVIAIQSNTNIMKNSLRNLPFENDNLFFVENYLEAVGLIIALKNGICLDSVSRPINGIEVINY